MITYKPLVSELQQSIFLLLSLSHKQTSDRDLSPLVEISRVGDVAAIVDDSSSLTDRIFPWIRKSDIITLQKGVHVMLVKRSLTNRPSCKWSKTSSEYLGSCRELEHKEKLSILSITNSQKPIQAHKWHSWISSYIFYEIYMKEHSRGDTLLIS